MRDRASLSLPTEPTAPGAARDFVRMQLTDVPADQLDEILIVVSELVTNAVRYGQAPIVLAVVATVPTVTISVTDDGAQQPVMASHDSAEPVRSSGRGLIIVEALTRSWGVTSAAGSRGKTVWFDYQGPAAAGARSPAGD